MCQRIYVASDAMAEVVASAWVWKSTRSISSPTLMRISLMSKVSVATRRTTTIRATAF